MLETGLDLPPRFIAGTTAALPKAVTPLRGEELAGRRNLSVRAVTPKQVR